MSLRCVASRVSRFGHSALLIASQLLFLAPPQVAWAQPIIPPGVLSRLAAGQPQDLIIQLDDNAIQEEAIRLRASEHVNIDNAKVLALKASRFATLKRTAFASLPAAEFEILKDYGQLPMAFVRLHSSNALNNLLARPQVVAIFEDEVRHSSQSTLPNLQLINQPAVAAEGLIGSGTTVAVIDTGVDYTNSAFGACTAPGDPFSCKVVTYQYICCNDGMLDPNSHGTNVAGIVMDVAPDARIAALRVLDASGTGTDSSILAALSWTITNKALYNIVAANMSLGAANSDNTSPCTGSTYVAAFANVRSAGILPAVAAGNDGFANGISSPACAPGAVSVGAVDNFDNFAYFSDSAPYLSLLAPGVGILAAGIYDSGTSQATPHIAGGAAVLRAEYPQDTVDQTVARMTTTGVPIVTPSASTTPRLDLYAASLPSPLTPAVEPLLTYAVGSAPYGVVVGDFNGDGKPDIIAANYSSNTISALFSHGGGFYPQSTASVGANPLGVATGDFNGDHMLDIVVANRGGTTVNVLLGNGNGTFSALAENTFAVGSGPYGITVADVDGDGIPDLVVANVLSNTVSVLLGIGNGTFLPQVSYPVGAYPAWVSVADFNGDGKPDIAVSNSGAATVSVLLNKGNGTFFTPSVPYTVGSNPIGIAAADLDGDGNIDLVTANTGSNNVSVLRGNGNGAFQPQVSLTAGVVPWGIAIADMNGDGLPDIVVANRDSANIGVFLGTVHKTFEPQITYATGPKPLFISIADFDGNHLPDIAVSSNSGNSVMLLLNRTDRIFASSFGR